MRLWRLIPLMLLIALLGFLARGLFLDPQHMPSARINQPLPEFDLPELLSAQSRLVSKDMLGHKSLLVVWASWCPACKEEQAFLFELKQQGKVIYGLDYKDHPDEAMVWLQEWGNPFKAIGDDRSGKVAMDLGVYGAPETFIIDEQGRVVYRHTGVLSRQIWMRDVLPYWNKGGET